VEEINMSLEEVGSYCKRNIVSEISLPKFSVGRIIE
jgi:hypothetical protein